LRHQLSHPSAVVGYAVHVIACLPLRHLSPRVLSLAPRATSSRMCSNDDTETIIFVDVDGVLNVGVCVEGGNMVGLSDESAQQAVQRVNSGERCNDVTQRLVAVYNQKLPDGSGEMYASLACGSNQMTSPVLTRRLAQLIRLAGERRTVVLSSSWRHPKHAARVRELEQILSRHMGTSFTFDTCTPPGSEFKAGDRLGCLGDFLEDYCKKHSGSSTASTCNPSSAGSSPSSQSSSSNSPSCSDNLLTSEGSAPEYAMNTSEEPCEEEEVLGRFVGHKGLAALKPRRALRVLVLDDFFASPLFGWEVDGWTISSQSDVERYLVRRTISSHVDVTAKLVHTYDECHLPDSGWRISVGAGITWKHFETAARFIRPRRPSSSSRSQKFLSGGSVDTHAVSPAASAAAVASQRTRMNVTEAADQSSACWCNQPSIFGWLCRPSKSPVVLQA